MVQKKYQYLEGIGWEAGGEAEPYCKRPPVGLQGGVVGELLQV